MKNYALQLMAALAGSFGGLNAKTIPSVKSVPNGSPKGSFNICMGREPKGQLRQAKPKSSGAAQLKREAKNRNNIRKRK